MIPQEQEEKRGEGARVVATEEQRELVGRLVSEAIDWSDKDKAPAFSDGKREWYRVKGAAIQAVLTDAETLARSSSSSASSDTESWTVKWVGEGPKSMGPGYAIEPTHYELDGPIQLYPGDRLIRDPAPEPPPVSRGTRADEIAYRYRATADDAVGEHRETEAEAIEDGKYAVRGRYEVQTVAVIREEADRG